jgi:hypothetical protein
LNRFIRRVGADVDELLDLGGRAEPGKFPPIELNFLSPHQLIEIESGANAAEGETVGLGDFINVVGRDHRACAGHILDNEVRVSRNIFAEIAGDQTRPIVIDAAGAVSGDDSNGLVLIEGRLAPEIGGRSKDESENEKDSIHGNPPRVSFVGAEHTRFATKDTSR